MPYTTDAERNPPATPPARDRGDIAEGLRVQARSHLAFAKDYAMAALDEPRAEHLARGHKRAAEHLYAGAEIAVGCMFGEGASDAGKAAEDLATIAMREAERRYAGPTEFRKALLGGDITLPPPVASFAVPGGWCPADGVPNAPLPPCSGAPQSAKTVNWSDYAGKPQVNCPGCLASVGVTFSDIDTVRLRGHHCGKIPASFDGVVRVVDAYGAEAFMRLACPYCDRPGRSCPKCSGSGFAGTLPGVIREVSVHGKVQAHPYPCLCSNTVNGMALPGCPACDGTAWRVASYTVGTG